MKNNQLEKEWYGIPKKEINWGPEVDKKKCIGCGLCVLECPTHVFRFDFDKHITEVIKSFKCIIGCSICANLCIYEAVILPSLSDLHKKIKSNNVIENSKEDLEYNKYMWM